MDKNTMIVSLGLGLPIIAISSYGGYLLYKKRSTTTATVEKTAENATKVATGITNALNSLSPQDLDKLLATLGIPKTALGYLTNPSTWEGDFYENPEFYANLLTSGAVGTAISGVDQLVTLLSDVFTTDEIQPSWPPEVQVYYDNGYTLEDMVVNYWLNDKKLPYEIQWYYDNGYSTEEIEYIYTYGV